MDKHYKLDFHLKICFHAASHVEMDAMVDTLLQLGIIGKIPELLLDGFIMTRAGANHMLSPHVIITLLENINHAVPLNQHQNAIKTVLKDIPKHSPTINGMLNQSTVFHHKLPKSKLKS